MRSNPAIHTQDSEHPLPGVQFGVFADIVKGIALSNVKSFVRRHRGMPTSLYFVFVFLFVYILPVAHCATDRWVRPVYFSTTSTTNSTISTTAAAASTTTFPTTTINAFDWLAIDQCPEFDDLPAIESNTADALAFVPTPFSVPPDDASPVELATHHSLSLPLPVTDLAVGLPSTFFAAAPLVARPEKPLDAKHDGMHPPTHTRVVAEVVHMPSGVAISCIIQPQGTLRQVTYLCSPVKITPLPELIDEALASTPGSSSRIAMPSGALAVEHPMPAATTPPLLALAVEQPVLAAASPPLLTLPVEQPVLAAASPPLSALPIEQPASATSTPPLLALTVERPVLEHHVSSVEHHVSAANTPPPLELPMAQLMLQRDAVVTPLAALPPPLVASPARHPNPTPATTFPLSPFAAPDVRTSERPFTLVREPVELMPGSIDVAIVRRCYLSVVESRQSSQVLTPVLTTPAPKVFTQRPLHATSSAPIPTPVTLSLISATPTSRSAAEQSDLLASNGPRAQSANEPLFEHDQPDVVVTDLDLETQCATDFRWEFRSSALEDEPVPVAPPTECMEEKLTTCLESFEDGGVAAHPVVGSEKGFAASSAAPQQEVAGDEEDIPFPPLKETLHGKFLSMILPHTKVDPNFPHLSEVFVPDRTTVFQRVGAVKRLLYPRIRTSVLTPVLRPPISIPPPATAPMPYHPWDEIRLPAAAREHRLLREPPPPCPPISDIAGVQSQDEHIDLFPVRFHSRLFLNEFLPSSIYVRDFHLQKRYKRIPWAKYNIWEIARVFTPRHYTSTRTPASKVAPFPEPFVYPIVHPVWTDAYLVSIPPLIAASPRKLSIDEVRNVHWAWEPLDLLAQDDIDMEVVASMDISMMPTVPLAGLRFSHEACDVNDDGEHAPPIVAAAECNSTDQTCVDIFALSPPTLATSTTTPTTSTPTPRTFTPTAPSFSTLFVAALIVAELAYGVHARRGRAIWQARARAAERALFFQALKAHQGGARVSRARTQGIYARLRAVARKASPAEPGMLLKVTSSRRGATRVGRRPQRPLSACRSAVASSISAAPSKRPRPVSARQTGRNSVAAALASKAPLLAVPSSRHTDNGEGSVLL